VHPRGLALLAVLAASACGRLSFDPAASDARGDGVPPSADAFDVTACHDTPGLATMTETRCP
jgi:hypothetical protein